MASKPIRVHFLRHRGVIKSTRRQDLVETLKNKRIAHTFRHRKEFQGFCKQILPRIIFVTPDQMPCSAEVTAKIVPKLAKMLLDSRRHLNGCLLKNAICMQVVEKFYVNFSIATLSLMKEHGNHLDFKELLQSTPQLKTYTTSVARKIVARDRQLRFALYHKLCHLNAVGGVLSATEVCHMRSGLEFFTKAFEDVPVLNSRRRRIDPLKKRYRFVIEELINFDKDLKIWASTYQFLEDDVIPTNIPVGHWWWEMTANDKPKEDFDFLSYKDIIINNV